MSENFNNLKTWHNDFLLHIEVIDNQHEKFFEIYDHTLNLINDNVNIDEEKIRNILFELSEYLKNHIRYEEELLRKSEFADIEQHINQHKYFIKRIEEFFFGLEYKNPQLLHNMLVFIKKWFLSHILETDAKYKETVTNYLKKTSKI